MNPFRQSFQNKQLERKFQHKILKQAIKSFKHYQIITIIIIAVLLIDQIIKQNLAMVIWFGILQAMQIIIFIISFKWPLFHNYIKIYYQSLEIVIASYQLFYNKFSFLNIEPYDLNIYMDILLQFFVIALIRFNYVESSIIFIYFISIRTYIQIANQLSLASLGYVISASYFFYDSFKQEKMRRKLFLKSQRNLQFELLIQEFIDDQVIILEKDEETVSFKSKILNKKLSAIYDDFNSFIKQVRLPQYKTKLINYLYVTKNENESFTCYYQNQAYQISFKVFILKKLQIFLKIKLLDQSFRQLVNYRHLHKYMVQNQIFYPNYNYRGKNIMKLFKFQSFYFQFSRFHNHFRIKLERISLQYLNYQFHKCKMRLIITNQDTYQFYTDKRLIYLLINLISNMILQKIIRIQIQKGLIRIQFSALEKINEKYYIEINKILHHIGYGEVEVKQLQNSKQVYMVLLDKDGFERFY